MMLTFPDGSTAHGLATGTCVDLTYTDNRGREAEISITGNGVSIGRWLLNPTFLEWCLRQCESVGGNRLGEQL